MLSALFAHSALHFDFGVERACSAAARVLLASPSRASPSSAAFLPYEAFPHAEERRLRIRASCGSALPSSGPTSSFLSSSMPVKYLLGGGRTCFPDRDCRCRPVSRSIFLRFCFLVPRSLFFIGATGRVFPAAIVYLLAPSFPKVNSDRRYLDVDSELHEASCLRGVSWVSNVSRGEMFEGIVAPTFLGWDQHGFQCLLFGRLFKV